MAKKKLNGSISTETAPPITPEERYRMVAEAAYYRALQRGFVGGSPEDDWLQAEQEINHTLLSRPDRKPERLATTGAGASLQAQAGGAARERNTEAK